MAFSICGISVHTGLAVAKDNDFIYSSEVVEHSLTNLMYAHLYTKLRRSSNT